MNEVIPILLLTVCFPIWIVFHYITKWKTAKGLTADVDPKETYLTPDVWYQSAEDLPLRDAEVFIMDSPKLREASILLRRDGGILLAGDFFHNTPKPDEFTNGLAGFGMRLAGLARPYNIGVGWFMMTKPSAEELRAILDIRVQRRQQ